MAMTLRLTPEETQALRETAKRERRSMQEVARTAVAEYVHRRAQRRTEMLSRIVDEDSALLKRLAE